MTNTFRSRYFSALCNQPNVLVPSEGFLEGDPSREPWRLPTEAENWLLENVGEESSTHDLKDGGVWNWGIQEFYIDQPKKMSDRFFAHFVFADQAHAAMFKMMFG